MTIEWFHTTTGPYLIGFYPAPEVRNKDLRDFTDACFRSLCCTYDCNMQIVEHPSQVFDLRALPYISIEEKTPYTLPVQDFTHPKRGVYIVGNSIYSHPSGWCEPQYRVHIDVPYINHPLYGFQAAAIVLHDREVKLHAEL